MVEPNQGIGDNINFHISSGQSSRLCDDSSLDSGDNRETIMVHKIGGRIVKTQNHAESQNRLWSRFYCKIAILVFFQVDASL